MKLNGTTHCISKPIAGKQEGGIHLLSSRDTAANLLVAVQAAQESVLVSLARAEVSGVRRKGRDGLLESRTGNPSILPGLLPLCSQHAQAWH